MTFLPGLDVAYHPTRLDAAGCAHWMDHYRAGLSHDTQLCQFNQLDSHDTSRFLTLLQGNRPLMKLALGWLFSWIGVPCLFYGDEIGLAGGNDPLCREPFRDRAWDQELLNIPGNWPSCGRGCRHYAAAPCMCCMPRAKP